MHRECLPEEGWLIFKSLKDLLGKYGAVLAGGTACAIHIGHRMSADLDFFTPKKFQVEPVLSAIRKTGYSFHVISEGEGSVILTIEGIKVSLFTVEYPFLEKTIVLDGIPVAGLLDIASMKIIAISQRGTKRDFVDLYFILQEIPFHKIADHMVRRFGRERVNPLYIGKSLVYFSDADSNPEPAYITGHEVTWEKIKSFFRNHVKQFVLDLHAARRQMAKNREQGNEN